MAQTEVKLLLNAIDNASKVVGGVTSEIGGLGKAASTGSDFLAGMGVNLSALYNPAMLAGQALKFMHDAAAEGELATAKLDAAVLRAGDSAGVTSGQLQAMALEMANLTGVEDEAIMGAQAILLKFDAIGGDIFPRVTQAALDLGAEMGDVGSSAQLVGKLMEAPAEAIGLLERQIGKLTAAEKAEIEASVASGNTAQAQAQILDILESKYGGLAETVGNTTVGSYNKLTVAIGNYAEMLGQATLLDAPVVSGLTDQLNFTTLLTQAVMDGNVSLAEAYVMRQKVTFTSYTAADAIAELTAKETESAAQTEATAGKEAILAATYGDVAASAADAAAQTGELAITTEQVSAATAKFTAELLFSKAAKSLDAEAAIALGVALGVVDTQTLILNEALPALTANYDANRDGIVSASEGAAQYSAELVKLYNNINNLPEQTKINIDVSVTGDPIPNIPGSSSQTKTGESGVALAEGADFYTTGPTRLLVGEAGTEHVVVTPVGAGATNNNNSASIVVNINGGIANAADAYEMAKEIGRLIGAR